jgi:hypothetical protein
MSKYVGTLRGALERVVYEVVKCVLTETYRLECWQCGADSGKWCSGTSSPFPHAARLKKGVNAMLRANVTIPTEEDQ